MSFSYPGTFILRSIFWRAICWSAVGWRTSLPASLSRFEWGRGSPGGSPSRLPSNFSFTNGSQVTREQACDELPAEIMNGLAPAFARGGIEERIGR